MMKKFPAFFFLFSLFCALSACAHIKRTVFIKLNNGQQILLMYDAYEGGKELDNKLNAALIALGIKKVAENYPDTWIDLSFEDPGVYDAGADLIVHLPLIEDVVQQVLPKDRFLSILNKVPGKPVYDVMSFAKPPKLSTFVTGDFTVTLALMNQYGWPKNLTIRSNDPRHDHYLSLIKNKEWLLKNGDYIRMGDLVKPSWKLRDKCFFFEPSARWPSEVTAKIKKKIEAISELENEQLEGLANFASIQTGVDYTPRDFLQPISYFKDKIDLSVVYEFLMLQKNISNIYGDAPILDVLLTLLKKDAPGTSVVILGEHNAHELVMALDELRVVAKKADVDPTQALGQLFNGF